MRLIIQFVMGWTMAFGAVVQAGAQTPVPPRIACPPATVTWFEGTGPARNGILLRWDAHVVSGGVVRADGRWRMPVQPSADQASGSYAVVVEQRGTGVQLGAWTCVVENASLPTPGVRQTTEPATATPTATDTAPTAEDAPTAAARTPASSTTASARTATAQPTSTENDENSPIVQPTTTATTAATATTRTATPGTATATTSTATTTGTTASPTSEADDPGDEAQCTVCIVSAEPSVDDAPAYLVISNDGGSAADLTGWTVRINGGASFTLPQQVLQPEESLTIMLAAADEDEEGVIYWPDATMAAGATLELANRNGAAQSSYQLDQD